MARQLKRWESPRREGRNHKGRGGTARKRQRQKQLKNLAKKLKQPEQNDLMTPSRLDFSPIQPSHNQKREGREHTVSSLFWFELSQYPAIAKPQLTHVHQRSMYSTIRFTKPA
jgi:hypothetical protein